MIDQTCMHCTAPLDQSSRDGVCKGCLTPERIEARLDAIPGPLGEIYRQAAREFGLIPRST